MQIIIQGFVSFWFKIFFVHQVDYNSLSIDNTQYSNIGVWCARLGVTRVVYQTKVAYMLYKQNQSMVGWQDKMNGRQKKKIREGLKKNSGIFH